MPVETAICWPEVKNAASAQAWTNKVNIDINAIVDALDLVLALDLDIVFNMLNNTDHKYK